MKNNAQTILIVESEKDNALGHFTDLEIVETFINNNLDGFTMVMSPDGHEVNVYSLDGFIQDFNSDDRRISSNTNFLKYIMFKQEIKIIS